MTQVLPYPLDAGPKVRAYHMLRSLARKHEVTLVSFVRADDPPAATAHLAQICAGVHTVPIQRSTWRNVRAGVKGLLTGLPMVVARDEMAEMFALLRQQARERYDVVHADQLSMAGYGQYTASATARAGYRPATVLDEHNAIYLLTQRMAAEATSPAVRGLMRREARAFARYERSMCMRFDAIFGVTDEDRERLLALAGPDERADLAKRLTVVPICVDPDAVHAVRRRAGGPPTILHLGTMFWPPNVQGVLWFAREVLPRIRRAVPAARFVIAGKQPPAEVVALGKDPGIDVTGYVADPTPYLAAADAFIVPVHAGGGMRVKILDGWLWGLPVVSTAVGAEGIVTNPGEDILLTPDGNAKAFADAVVRVLTDPALNATLRCTGRAAVEARYGWQAVYGRVDAAYAQLLARTSSPENNAIPLP